MIAVLIILSTILIRFNSSKSFSSTSLSEMFYNIDEFNKHLARDFIVHFKTFAKNWESTMQATLNFFRILVLFAWTIAIIVLMSISYMKKLFISFHMTIHKTKKILQVMTELYASIMTKTNLFVVTFLFLLSYVIILLIVYLLVCILT